MAVVASQQKKVQPATFPVAIPIAAAWHVVIAIASIALSMRVFEGDQFRDLGDIVQQFLGIVALLPAIAALVLIAAIASLLFLRKPVAPPADTQLTTENCAS